MENRINLCFLLIKDLERELAQRVEDLTAQEGQNLLLQVMGLYATRPHLQENIALAKGEFLQLRKAKI